MNIILLSGGSGKRLWPLSNETRSKQFLQLIPNGDHELESMVQRVFHQIHAAGIDARIVVATCRTQVDSIYAQLGESVDIVVEPERRDTFPAIALASAYLALKRNMDPDEVIVVLPVDPYADLRYFSLLLEMEAMVRNGTSHIVLMGIKPTYPSSKYGYIVPLAGTTSVDHFQEKPSEEQAEELIRQGALWNGGVFAFRLGYLQEILRQHIEFDDYDDLLLKYSSLPKRSFDYEVVEKEPLLSMVEYLGIWKDLGTWNTLTEVMADPTSGNVLLGDDCTNTHVLNELNIPIIVLGTRDIVVAASPNGILVSDKQSSAHMKSFVDRIDHRPMFEECRWGRYTVLEYIDYPDGCLSLTQHLFIKAGAQLSYLCHASRDEVLTIVDGTGFLVVDGSIRAIHRGDHVFISKGEKHALKATTDMHFIEVQVGDLISEEDKTHFEFEW